MIMECVSATNDSVAWLNVDGTSGESPRIRPTAST
jgi:hypothetical protein